MKIPFYHVDAFTDRIFKGNPAAVCLLVDWLPDATMQNIAYENNLSETAFVVGNKGQYQIRWFTPTTEVEFCGHATLASAHILFAELGEPSDHISFQGKIGTLTVSQHGDALQLSGPAIPSDPITVPEALKNHLKENLVATLANPIQDFIVVTNNQEVVESVTAEITTMVPEEYRGVIVTSTGISCDFVSRWFGIDVGVIEDPFTGSAHCQLAPYWSQKLGKTNLTAVQLSQRQGHCTVNLEGDTVHLIGKAKTYCCGFITIN